MICEVYKALKSYTDVLSADILVVSYKSVILQKKTFRLENSLGAWAFEVSDLSSNHKPGLQINHYQKLGFRLNPSIKICITW